MTEQRLCAVRFCGHPESSHFCEDEGGPESYHGDDWCADCEKLGTAHEFEPASTPTPSLEEARQSVIRCEACKGRGGFSDTTMGRGGYGGQMLTGCRACSGSGLDTRELEAFIKATARAEVIREVEAVERSLRESATRLARFSNSYMDGESAGLIAAADSLRALSQGGEGKA